MKLPIARLDGLHTGGPDVSVQMIEYGSQSWWLRVSGGRARVGSGFIRDATFWLRATDHSMSPLWRIKQSITGVAAPDVSGDGKAWAPMFPFGVDPQPETADLIPGLSITVQHVNHRSPIGVVRYHDTFLDGRLAARVPGVARRPSAVVENTFGRMVASLQSGANLLESIAGARVYARDPSVLMMVAGLYESEELRMHLCPPSANAMSLSALASNTQSSAWQQVVTTAGVSDD